jgi:hypothetical protein
MNKTMSTAAAAIMPVSRRSAMGQYAKIVARAASFALRTSL